MLEISAKTNLLEENDYRYSLQDVEEPILYRDVYNYEEVPKIAFNHRRVPMSMPEDIWITDTSFRDGQQSVNPYTPDQIVELYKMMSRLGGPYGRIRQTEFFVYSKKDREAIERCMDLGLKFPEITTWIRASREDFRLVKELGVRETGSIDIIITTDKQTDVRRQLFNAAARAGTPILLCKYMDITLEDIFLQFTGYRKGEQ